jgi:outer membrane cobalamin receptor
LSGDVYWNRITDKIVAFPSGNMAYWTVVNYGKVDGKGLDLNATVQIRTSKILWEVNGAYTYQDVLNKTKSNPDTYNKRILYTARHSASGSAGLKTPWVDVNYTFLYCGKRYSREDNAPETQTKPFVEQGVSLIRTLEWKQIKATVTAECVNLLDRQYEVVNSYPMSGRSFRLGLKLIY